jgi:2-C-methyl-D-erythritol 4-phosphate cytidylyltransferase
MGAAVPKQYLPLSDGTVLECTLQRLLAEPRIEQIQVAISAQDAWWPLCRYADHPRLAQCPGGAERSDSVLNALESLAPQAADEDWVLVHDAARPCLHRQDLQRLFQQLDGHPVGGLLGVPVRDTMKRTGPHGQIMETVDRSGLWHAFTPQMFRFDPLRQALQMARQQGRPVTDDASAMELAGLQPLMVEGRDDNLKVTRPSDLALAAFILQRQQQEQP